MRKFSIIIPLMVLLLAGFRPIRGASLYLPDSDSLPLRRGVVLTTDAQKRALIYKDTKGAKELLLRSIEEDSTYSPAYYHLAQIYSSEMAQSDSMLYYSRKAYELDSLCGWYNESYTQALALTGDLVEARRLCAKTIKRTPQDPSPYIMMAMLYRQSNMPLAAISIIDSAEVTSGKNSYLSTMKRDLLLATGQRDRAIEESQSAVELEPTNIENRLILAQLYASTRQDSLARVEYANALKIDSTSVAVMQSMSQFYLSTAKYDDYLATLKRLFESDDELLEDKIINFKHITSDKSFYGRYLLNIDILAASLWRQYPDDRRVVQLYTDHLIAVGRLDSALEIYKERTRRRPAEYQDFKMVIDIESYKQHIDTVERYTLQALELFPEQHELHLTRANLYAYTQQYEKAIKNYRKTMDILPTDTLKSQVLGNIGDNYHQMSLQAKAGSYKQRRVLSKAYECYDEALEVFADNSLVLNNYAYFLSLEKSNLEKALNMAGRAVALTDKNPTYMDTYAWILYELGRFDQAKKIMQQAIALDTTGSAELPFHYAEILVALGENFMAEIYYGKALKLGYDKAVIESKLSKIK